MWFLTFSLDGPWNQEKNFQRQYSAHNESLDITLLVQETTTHNTPAEEINRFADVLFGMNNRSSGQTLIIRPVSTTTLTLDEKSEKFDVFENLFHTMSKMLPDMTEKWRKTFSFVTAQKKCCKHVAVSVRQIDRLWRTFWQFPGQKIRQTRISSDNQT